MVQEHTAAEKAKILVNKFYQPLGLLHCAVSNSEMWKHAKECAKIVCDEMLHSELEAPHTEIDQYMRYWHAVKAEIEKL